MPGPLRSLSCAAESVRDAALAREWLRLSDGTRFEIGGQDHLHEACIGSISEVFDAIEPYAPQGRVAPAGSGAEVLRGWARTAAPDAGAGDR